MLKEVNVHPRLETTIVLDLPQNYQCFVSDTEGKTNISFRASDDYLQQMVHEMEEYLPAIRAYLKSIPGR